MATIGDDCFSLVLISESRLVWFVKVYAFMLKFSEAVLVKLFQ